MVDLKWFTMIQKWLKTSSNLPDEFGDGEVGLVIPFDGWLSPV